MSLLTIIVGNGVAMIASDPALVVATRAITGAGTGIGFIAASEYVRAAGGSPFAQGLFGGFGDRRRRFALAVVPLLERAVGWRSPFVLMVALALVALAALLLSPLPRGGGPSGLRPSRVTGPPGDRRPAGCTAFAAMHTAAFGLSVVVGNWVVTLLEHHGYSTALASTLGALTLGMSVVSRPLGGWLDAQPSAPGAASP